LQGLTSVATETSEATETSKATENQHSDSNQRSDCTPSFKKIKPLSWQKPLDPVQTFLLLHFYF
jgi:hypothetical protein